MDNGASSYRRFLDGDRNSFTELVREYWDGLTLYLSGLPIALQKPRNSPRRSFSSYMRKDRPSRERARSKHGFMLSGAIRF